MSSRTNSSTGGVAVAAFPATLWPQVLKARDGNDGEGREALAALCKLYRYPVYAFIRRKGKAHHEAEDLTQEFFARFIEKEFLGPVDPDKGRFRTFLLTLVQRFLCTEWERSQAQERGGGAVFCTWDAEWADDRYTNEPAHNLTPEKLFDRNWLSAVLTHAMADLKAEYAQAGQAEILEVLEPFVVRDAAYGGYSEAAARLKMTEGNARQWASRIRQRYGECIRARIAETVDSEAAVEEELRSLYAALAG